MVWRNSSRIWDEFAESVGKHLAGDQNLDKELAKTVANRAFSYLRWADQDIGESLAFFHARHHTLRSCSIILAFGTAGWFLAYILGGRVDSVEQWFAWALVPVVGAIIAWLMFSAATTELQTLIEHYTFVTAQQEGNLREWTRKFLVMKTALRAANQGEAK